LKKPVPRFRTVDQWKSALMTLPDSNFFELLRSVFGNIKTPFSKQRLLDDLFALLSREDIRKTIAGYIDEKDHKMIAAVALLQEPEPPDLQSFFQGEMSYPEIHHLLLNLEERLILYRFQDEKVRRLALNPVLASILNPLTDECGILFPALAGPPVPAVEGGDAFIPDGRVMATLIAFITEEEYFFKSEGGIRKKVLEGAKKLFPSLDIELAAGALEYMGLVSAEGDRLVPQEKAIRDFGGLSAGERREYWAAGVFLKLNEGDAENRLKGFARGPLRWAGAMIHRFCGVLDHHVRYPEITLKRFACLLSLDDGGTAGFWGWHIEESKKNIPFKRLFKILLSAGIIQAAGDLYLYPVFPESGNEPEKAAIAMDSAFSFVLYPEIHFADALTLSAFCSPKGKAGEGFELTRSSAVRGFDSGLSSDSMVQLLKRLSLDRIDSNLEFTLKDWEARYTSVSLHQGLVLTLAEDRRYLADAEPLASMVTRILAPGVYLLSGGDRAGVAVALRKAGVDIVAQPAAGQDIRGSGASIRPNTFQGLERISFPLPKGMFVRPGFRAAEERTRLSLAAREQFLKRLQTMKLSKPERDELEARIERRLVLTESQLEKTTVRYEKLEARGMDYAGKSVMAKQAISGGTLLEVTWPAGGGAVSVCMGTPVALEKSGGETILVLKPVSFLPGEEAKSESALRIPLGKISLLRRIKQSIFGE
jgi:hypothetical protein